MADNTTLPGTGEVIRDKDRAGIKTQIFGIDVGIAGAEALLSVTNPLPVSEIGCSTAAITSPALAITSFTLLVANTAREQALFFNDSDNIVYLAFAATASVTAFTVQIPPDGYYEMPRPIYTGLITGIALVATGNVRVTEVV